MSKTYKVQLFTSEIKGEEFTDLYLDIDSITGCYKADKASGFPEEKEAINIFHDGGISTILDEKHIADALFEKFVKNCIENK